jgi:hypothetical protein
VDLHGVCFQNLRIRTLVLIFEKITPQLNAGFHQGSALAVGRNGLQVTQGQLRSWHGQINR